MAFCSNRHYNMDEMLESVMDSDSEMEGKLESDFGSEDKYELENINVNVNELAINTAFICKTCPSQPGLHPRECVEMCHMVLDFKVQGVKDLFYGRKLLYILLLSVW